MLFHDLLSRPDLYQFVWSIITANNLTPAKRDESIRQELATHSHTSSWVMKWARYNTSVVDYARLHSHDLLQTVF